ncbi:hypothetical protein LR48_Vigan06g066600 [Vigna angularis]|uniref:Uncharacterized protein n=1 Tax=Phaseolus angularis TaxID=3914 RepID=A0A0L9UR39_PHAAN|nr:hypothetical protein LR48_Vigan06g066600 [Vigna angularis]
MKVVFSTVKSFDKKHVPLPKGGIRRPSPSSSVTVSHRVDHWLCLNRVSVIQCVAIAIGVHPSQRVVVRGLEGCSWRGLTRVWFVRVSAVV